MWRKQGQYITPEECTQQSKAKLFLYNNNNNNGSAGLPLLP